MFCVTNYPKVNDCHFTGEIDQKDTDNYQHAAVTRRRLASGTIFSYRKDRKVLAIVLPTKIVVEGTNVFTHEMRLTTADLICRGAELVSDLDAEVYVFHPTDFHLDAMMMYP